MNASAIGTYRSLGAFAIGSFSRTKREQYDKDMYDEKRCNGELAAAREDGIAEGLAQGHAEGRAEGREEGRAEGREEANMEVARKMLAAGMPVEHIVQFTGLDRETVENL